jgi:hypothetical protein
VARPAASCGPDNIPSCCRPNSRTCSHISPKRRTRQPDYLKWTTVRAASRPACRPANPASRSSSVPSVSTPEQPATAHLPRQRPPRPDPRRRPRPAHHDRRTMGPPGQTRLDRLHRRTGHRHPDRSGGIVGDNCCLGASTSSSGCRQEGSHRHAACDCRAPALSSPVVAHFAVSCRRNHCVRISSTTLAAGS